MKNIYDKLNPDILASIKADQETYPYTTKELITKLKASIDWSELSVSNVQSIINHSHESFFGLSYQDIIWGDKFLINE
tara:strand:+ start:394 stop:627 length:234 start_codon:yes stop_codon:yes gene_type:complete